MRVYGSAYDMGCEGVVRVGEGSQGPVVVRVCLWRNMSVSWGMEKRLGALSWMKWKGTRQVDDAWWLTELTHRECDTKE